MSECHTGAEEQIAVWRCALLEHDALLRDDIDELVAHVREGAAHRVENGVDEAAATGGTIAAMGTVWRIALEYEKAHPERVWRRRVQRMLAGPLALTAFGTLTWYVGALLSILLTTLGAPDRWAFGAACAVCGIAVALALLAVILVSFGRPRRALAGLRERVERWRAALLNSRRGRVAFLAGAFATTTALLLAPLPSSFPTPPPIPTHAAETIWLSALLTFSVEGLVGVLVLLVLAHVGRFAASRSPLAARGTSLASARIVRWGLLGLIPTIALPCVAGLLGGIAAGLVTRRWATYEETLVAQVGAQMALLGLAASAALLVSRACPRRPLLALSRGIARLRRASWARVLGICVAAVIGTTVALTSLLIAAMVSLEHNEYAGLGEAGLTCLATAIAGVPARHGSLLLLTIRRERRRATDSLRGLDA